MRPSRFNLWTATIAVLFSSLFVGIGLLWARAMEFQRQAESFALAEHEADSRLAATESGAAGPRGRYSKRSLEDLRLAVAAFKKQRIKYERAASHPWLPLEPDAQARQ